MCVWHFYFCFCRYRCRCRARARVQPHLLSYSLDRLTPRPSTGRGLIYLSRARALCRSRSLRGSCLLSLSLSYHLNVDAFDNAGLSLFLSLARTLILPPPLYVRLYLCLFLSPDLSTQSTSRPWVARKLTTRALSPILFLSLYSSFPFFVPYSPTLLPAPPRGLRWRGG